MLLTFDDVPTVGPLSADPLVVSTPSSLPALDHGGTLLRRLPDQLWIQHPVPGAVVNAMVVPIDGGYVVFANAGEFLDTLWELGPGGQADPRYPYLSSVRQTGRIDVDVSGSPLSVEVVRPPAAGVGYPTLARVAVPGDLATEWAFAVLLSIPVAGALIRLMTEWQHVTHAVAAVFDRALNSPSKTRLEQVSSVVDFATDALELARDLGVLR
jgi:hypothetical protein